MNTFRRGLAMLLVAGGVGGCAAPRQAVRTLPPWKPSASAGALTHTVAPHETLWSIGKRYGVSSRDLMQANALTDPRQVPVGSTLLIPRPAVPRLVVPLSPNPQWTHIVIHHSATATGNARTLDRIHRKRGFTNGLGYHFVIDNGTAGRRDGQLEVGRRWLRQEKGAHCDAGGMNQHGIGICLIGDFTHRPPSPAQLELLAALVNRLRTYYAIPRARVIRHRDVAGKATACPGDRFPWATFRRRLASPR
jgi:LysM repeat protein